MNNKNLKNHFLKTFKGLIYARKEHRTSFSETPLREDGRGKKRNKLHVKKSRVTLVIIKLKHEKSKSQMLL